MAARRRSVGQRLISPPSQRDPTPWYSVELASGGLVGLRCPMAIKPTLSLDSLQALGAAKLASLVFDEAASNPAFKRRVVAALAGQGGPVALAKVLDKRLAGLERARSFVDWDKARGFRDDLAALLAGILQDLAPLDPAMAIDRLVRFIATHEAVFERVDDSGGHVQAVYGDAIDAVEPLAARLDGKAAGALPGQIMDRLGESEHGYLPRVAAAAIVHLPPSIRLAWDADLVGRITARDEAEAPRRAAGRWFHSMTGQWREIRQHLALAQGDLDLLLGIEDAKPERQRDTLGAAERLRAAGRFAEALVWVREGGRQHHVRLIGLEGEDRPDDSPAVRQALLEAEILTDLGQPADAQHLRWSMFAETLAPVLLSAHLKALPDFDDIEAEERAFTIALDHPDFMAALRFFLAWRRDDLAERLIVQRRTEVSGKDWHLLPAIADLLQHEAPLAATILYRALLGEILGQARSKAYGHGAGYLAVLERLALGSDTNPDRPLGVVPHAEFLAALRRDHGRKLGFWALVEGRVTRLAPEPRRGRVPKWVDESD